MSNLCMAPGELVKQLDKWVVGQGEAKRAAALTGFLQYLRMAQQTLEPKDKSLGPDIL